MKAKLSGGAIFQKKPRTCFFFFLISPLKIRRSGFQNFQSQEERTGIQRWEEFVFMWVLTSGLAQVGWELPFVLWKARARNLNKCFNTI